MVTTITGLVIYLVILPTIKDIRGINEDVYAERVDLEKKYLRGQLLRKTVEDFEKIRPEKDKLSSVFIPEKEELKFITDLEKIAANNNLLQIIGLEQSKDAGEKGNFYPIPLRIKTSGEF